MFWIEMVAAVSGLVSIYLVARQNIWCWPVGIVSVVLYVFIFHDARLYSDLILHLVYVALQVYGWIHWTRGNLPTGSVPPADPLVGDPLPVTSMRLAQVVGWIVVVLVGTLGWGWGMETYTDASMVYGDAFTTVGSLVAQWLTARKRIESWIFWFVIDVVAIGIYVTKGLYMTSVLYALLLLLCVLGYREWNRSLSGSEHAVTPMEPVRIDP